MTDLDTDEHRPACPACDTLDVAPRARKPGWYCKQCGASFQRPASRRRKSTGGGRAGLAGVLERMDPDEVP